MTGSAGVEGSPFHQTRQQRFGFTHLPDPHLTPLTAPFPHRSPRRSSSNAACGALKAPPEGRLRRAKPSSLAQHRFLKSLLHRDHHSSFVAHAIAFSAKGGRAAVCLHWRLAKWTPRPRDLRRRPCWEEIRHRRRLANPPEGIRSSHKTPGQGRVHRERIILVQDARELPFHKCTSVPHTSSGRAPRLRRHACFPSLEPISGVVGPEPGVWAPHRRGPWASMCEQNHRGPPIVSPFPILV
jgi:hypothetical protein